MITGNWMSNEASGLSKINLIQGFCSKNHNVLFKVMGTASHTHSPRLA